MPVTDQTPIIAHTANGVSTAFAFPFLLDQSSDLIVMVGDALKTLATDYTVGGTGNPAGGTVTFTTAPANGVRVVFTRRTALQRLTDYQTGGANRANVLDADLDRLWLALQDGWLGVQKAVRYQNGDSGPTRMPVLADGQVLGQLGGALVGRDLASADSMNFLQSGAGAMTRSMQDKAREIVSVKDFGAKGDGVTDDTNSINAALLAGAGRRVVFPAGTYLINADVTPSSRGGDEGGIAPQSGTTLVFDPGVIVKVKPSSSTDYNAIRLYMKSNVEIIGNGAVIQGDRATHVGLTGEWGHGITVLGCTGIRISDVTVQDCWGDGIYTGEPRTSVATHNTSIRFKNVTSNNNRRNALSLTSGDDVEIIGCRFTNTNGTAPQAGCDIEPNYSHQTMRGVTFIDCEFSGNSGRGLVIDSKANISEVVVSGCRVSGNQAEGVRVTPSTSAVISNVRISASAINGDVSVGYSAGSVSGVQITGSYVNAARAGVPQAISLAYASNVQISGSTISGIVSANSYVSGFTFSGNSVFVASASGSMFSTSFGSGGCSAYSVVGNTFIATGTDGSASAAVDLNAVSGFVFSNNIVDTGNRAIFLQGNYANGVVSGNIVRSSKEGIMCSGAGDAIVFGNTINSSATTKMQLANVGAKAFNNNGFQAHSLSYQNPPNSGTWGQGDICWSMYPGAGGPLGWVCVTAGTPGTWKQIGSIAA